MNEGFAYSSPFKATQHAKSLEAAQDLLGALKGIKARLDVALSHKSITPGFYADMRRLNQQMEQGVRSFAAEHEQGYAQHASFNSPYRGSNGMLINKEGLR